MYITNSSPKENVGTELLGMRNASNSVFTSTLRCSVVYILLCTLYNKLERACEDFFARGAPQRAFEMPDFLIIAQGRVVFRVRCFRPGCEPGPPPEDVWASGCDQKHLEAALVAKTRNLKITFLWDRCIRRSSSHCGLANGAIPCLAEFFLAH